MSEPMPHQRLNPKNWKPARGYANGVAATGRMIFLGGHIGWNGQQEFQTDDFVAQVDQTLANIVAVLAEAGGKPEHICRITAFCCDKPEYLRVRGELGKIWRSLMGKHFPAMSMIFVSDLLDHPGKIELEATAVVPG